MKKRADGRWQKKITLPNGKQKFLYSNASTERLATKDFNEQMLTLEQESISSSNFSSVAERWKEKHFPKMQDNTLKQYKPGYKEAVKYFGDIPITEIKPYHIKEYADFLIAKQYAEKTIKNRLLIVSLIFKYAILLPDIDVIHNPCFRIPLEKGLPKKKRETASKSDELKICHSPCETIFEILAYLYLTTGCRRGEALALTPNDVNIKELYITIDKTVVWNGNRPKIKPIPKTDAGERNIPITKKLAKLLKPFLKNNWIFEIDKGQLFTNSQMTRGWDNLRENLNINCTPHNLRHSYATMLFDAGVDIKTAQLWLGHKDINTTLAIYTHLSNEMLERTTKKFKNYLENNY